MIKFPIGDIVATPGAMAMDSTSVQRALLRHATGDWGDVPPEDKQLNDEALLHGDRLLSAYKAADGTPFWIITEADRSVTTILLPEDY